MSDLTSPPSLRFTETARVAALAAKAAKRAEPDAFGLPELFVMNAGDQSFHLGVTAVRRRASGARD